MGTPGLIINGEVKAGGTLELVGKVAVKRVEPLTKVIIRAEQ